MEFTLNEKLNSGDLSTDFYDGLVSQVRSLIEDNEELMAEIKEFCEEENKDNVEGKLSLQDYINLKIDEMADEAVSRLRIYCEFDVEVKL